jgi:hypothetical protein
MACAPPQLQQHASSPAAALQPQQPWEPSQYSRREAAGSNGGGGGNQAQPPRTTLSWSPDLHAAHRHLGTTEGSTGQQQQQQQQYQNHQSESTATAPAAASAAQPSMQNRDQAPQPRATPPTLLARRQRPQSPWAHGSWEARSEGAESEQVSAVDAAGSDGCAANDLRVPSVQRQLLWCQRPCAFTSSCATGGSLVSAPQSFMGIQVHSPSPCRCGSCQPRRCQHTLPLAAQQTHTHHIAARAMCTPHAVIPQRGV